MLAPLGPVMIRTALVRKVMQLGSGVGHARDPGTRVSRSFS